MLALALCRVLLRVLARSPRFQEDHGFPAARHQAEPWSKRPALWCRFLLQLESRNKGPGTFRVRLLGFIHSRAQESRVLRRRHLDHQAQEWQLLWPSQHRWFRVLPFSPLSTGRARLWLAIGSRPRSFRRNFCRFEARPTASVRARTAKSWI